MKLMLKPQKIQIMAATNKGLFYGAATLCQLIREYGAFIPCCEIEDKPYFKNRSTF